MLERLQRISRAIESNLVLFMALSITAGVLFGWVSPAATSYLKYFNKIALFIMLYPMMVGLRIEEVGKAATNMKLIGLSMVFNFILSPLVAGGLAYVLLHDRPDFAVGLILTGTVPCAGMVAGWTGYAKGNVALAMVIVVISLLVSIIAIPIWMPILAGVYVQLDALAMLKDILITVVVPLILGDMTRRLIIRWGGHDAFHRIKPILPGASMLGMYVIVFVSMALESENILNNPQLFLIVFAPLSLLYLIMFGGAVLFAKVSRFSYENMIAFTYGVAGKNIAIALALATIFFSPMTVLVLAIKPVVQIAFMALFLRATPFLRKSFAGFHGLGMAPTTRHMGKRSH
ncbi:MAG TPA: bile acid:sodium symporter [Desulfovibrio sp.]|uniref:arsenic resistance protein n=1 Tax=Desulfovibrio sp. TaxID=885 RepID=UPI002BA7E62C|nr:bile acid:sodium symporter [Desulfovibrio sp.]HMM37540.1 bile acid:sodium symporter [Desulfovibrio sp.]